MKKDFLPLYEFDILTQKNEKLFPIDEDSFYMNIKILDPNFIKLTDSHNKIQITYSMKKIRETQDSASSIIEMQDMEEENKNSIIFHIFNTEEFLYYDVASKDI